MALEEKLALLRSDWDQSPDIIKRKKFGYAVRTLQAMGREKASEEIWNIRFEQFLNLLKNPYYWEVNHAKMYGIQLSDAGFELDKKQLLDLTGQIQTEESALGNSLQGYTANISTINAQMALRLLQEGHLIAQLDKNHMFQVQRLPYTSFMYNASDQGAKILAWYARDLRDILLLTPTPPI
jgi:hypothetical protein